jgi:hypothetical protein
MNDKFSLETLDVGLALDLKMAFRRNGWSEVEIKKLTAGDMLARVRDVLIGCSEITAIKNIIDLDANPFVPNGWAVEEHKKGGLLDLSKSKIALFLTKKQKKGAVIGNDLRKDFADQPVLNANLLDFYLANQHLIPEDWKGKYVFFWGTIYRDSDGNLFVRCLFWNGGRWGWDCGWLVGDWDADGPAVCGQATST